jgi:DNA-binding CsgD family transcriptional regulator
MELIERSGFLDSLQKQFDKTSTGEGHTIFISGEAGIGKTSLLKAFSRKQEKKCIIYQGACDALFTPRPLAPLFDIGWQIRTDFWSHYEVTEERPALFSRFIHELTNHDKMVILLFEDIHWADEATLDFIKFLSRRISRFRCLFILTYRDNEINSNHPLKSVFGNLPPDSFTRLQLTPLSKEAVDAMAREKGYKGEDVYSISGGNPFYVTEILASYSAGIPDNIKDAVLSVYNRQEGKTKEVWELLSVTPAGLEIEILSKAEPDYEKAIENCLDARILLFEKGIIYFKHELYRRTIETSMSPFRRIALNKKLLDVLLLQKEQSGKIERVIHHAKNANDYDSVVKYAPVAAKQAALVGAHIEASKLYFTAIEYYQGNNKDLLVEFYGSYSYECYLTYKIRDAIIYQGKLLNILKERNEIEETGDSLRFLSRLWWFEGNRKQAESYAEQAIALLEKQPVSRVKAMAYSNMSQLKMLSDHFKECMFWGEQAIAMANELNDDEILAHALNNVGSAQAKVESLGRKGAELIQQSLDIALKNSYHEHAARAYTNLGSDWICVRQYKLAQKALDDGIGYCEARDLDSWTNYMQSCKARLKLETGNWDEAFDIANNLLRNEDQTAIIKIIALAVIATISMRKGDTDPLPVLLETKTNAFKAGEHQRIVPAIVALLEYEWLTGKSVIEKESLDLAIKTVEEVDNMFQNSEFSFWLYMARKQSVHIPKLYEGYVLSNKGEIENAAGKWRGLGCPYEEALALYHGNEEDKKNAITIVQQLGGTAVYNKMKQEMKDAGVKSIPRGIRSSTKTNPAFLTSRELEILQLLHEGLQNKEIGGRLFISAKTVDHHISSILFKLDVNSRAKAAQEAKRLGIIK